MTGAAQTLSKPLVQDLMYKIRGEPGLLSSVFNVEPVNTVNVQ